MDKLSVLIPDGETVFALFVARCLAQVPHLQLHILSSDPWAPLRFSRYRRTCWYNRQADYYGEAYLEAIRQTVNRTGATVLLPVAEPAIRFTSAQQNAIKEFIAIAPVPMLEAFDIVINKWGLADFIKKNQLSGPPTILYTADEAFEQNLAEVPFPVLAKPTRGDGGQGIHYFDQPVDLQNFLTNTVQQPSSQYIVQSFVPGYDVDCSVLCQEGEILAYTIQRGFLARARSFAAPAGIDFIEDEQVFEVVRQLISALKWSGVAHLDLRYDSQAGQVKIIEFNARYWVSLIGSLIVGVNFPYLACLAGLGLALPASPYCLGRYVAPASAIKQWGLGMLGKRRLEFTFRETGLTYILADPLAEIVKLCLK